MYQNVIHAEIKKIKIKSFKFIYYFSIRKYYKTDNLSIWFLLVQKPKLKMLNLLIN